jgi:hypothetical protein
MPEPLRDTLIRQLDTAWALATYHLDSLSDRECLWRPADEGLHIWADGLGGWRADRPGHEGYDLGPRADQSLADVFAWANIELTKNAAELGYARFLFAIRAV